ncbi:MAG: hypothetical protein AB8B67_03985 [Rickettsiaceae bacterium]
MFLWTKALLPKKHRAKPVIKIDMQQLQADIAQYSDVYQYERAGTV